jgi:hypothetical protein
LTDSVTSIPAKPTKPVRIGVYYERPIAAFEGCRFAIKAAAISLAIGIVGATLPGKMFEALSRQLPGLVRTDLALSLRGGGTSGTAGYSTRQSDESAAVTSEIAPRSPRGSLSAAGQSGVHYARDLHVVAMMVSKSEYFGLK